jgi:predicted amidohydrolase YtcJ
VQCLERLAFLVVLTSSVAAGAADVRHADLVLKNAVVHTLDPQRPRAEAVAIHGGSILAVGSDVDVAAFVGPATRVLDLRGATVIPGFKESHGHLLGLGAQKLRLDLVGTTGYREVVDRVAAAVAARKPGEWILGRGWHEGKWTDRRDLAASGFPTHHALSKVSPENPVYLTRADGHAGLANAKAMQLMGIGKETEAPEGGDILKGEDGLPTGIFVDRAQALIKVPPPTPEEQRVAFAAATRDCLEKGITAFDDAGADVDAIALYKEEAKQGRLPLRLYVMASGLETMRRLERPETDLAGGRLTIRAVKLYADGALGSRGAALLEPYSDDRENSGLLVTPPGEILAATRYALAHGFQACIHAIGDRANRLVLDTFEKAAREFPDVKDPRFRIEHAQILDERDIARFASLGVVASMQGIHATSDRPWAIDRLGPARVAEGAYVWRKLLASGARIANGTDAPVESVDPLRCFYASVTRQDESGQPAGGFDPDQRMTREQALRSYTLDGAYAAFQEGRNGSVESGKRADLTVLSKDIMMVPAPEILETRVLYTIVDGRIAFERPGPAN